MKNTLFLVLMTVVSISLAGHLRLENRSYETVAYIRDDGSIEDASFMPMGRMVNEEESNRIRIEDCGFNVLGYIEDGQFLDSDENRIYELADGGRLKNHRYRDVATIRDDGTVEATNFSIMLYTDGNNDTLKERIAVYLIYFSDLLE